MNQIVMALMRLLAAAGGRGALAPSERAAAYLPTPPKLRAALSNATERQRVVGERLAATRRRWDDLQTAGLIGKLDQARVLDAQMRTDPQAPQPILGLPGAEVRFFHDKLAMDTEGQSANRLGRELIEGRSTLAAVTGSAAKSEEAVMHLRRLDDVLLRIQAAGDAARLTASPLHEVLALYRVEGDLGAPPSQSELTDGIPSGTDDASSSIDAPAMPDITHLVILLHPGATVSGFIDLNVDTDPDIQGAGLKYWFVQIAGLDVVGHQPRDWRTKFAAWSSANWARSRCGTAARGHPPESGGRPLECAGGQHGHQQRRGHPLQRRSDRPDGPAADAGRHPGRGHDVAATTGPHRPAADKDNPARTPEPRHDLPALPRRH